MKLDEEEQSKPKATRRKEIIKLIERINIIKNNRESQVSDIVKKKKKNNKTGKTAISLAKRKRKAYHQYQKWKRSSNCRLYIYYKGNIYHDQAGFILDMQRWFKSVSVICHISKTKDKNPRLIPIGAEKVFNKI